MKRKIVTDKECRIDLANELPKLFTAFKNAVTMFQKEIVQTPPQSRARAFEANLLNSKMIQSIQETFPRNWKFGKYKRFILNLSGYTVLFKKLNSKDMPMNIRTSHSMAIYNQLQTSLFDNQTLSIDPIVFFGYKKGKFGDILDPKLVYVDEDQVKWTLTEDMIVERKVITMTRKPVIKALPKLKQNIEQNKRKTK
ncbi:hypothetical protein [Seonamhaeicola marinus]|uniref:Uncharacterized protein n=1 Tax=Seonamhaeicola marinus TaxID=1912246 RepID=A0A5D0HYA6_9FLAO|nr:hypothetical protein [Seonamhaeicola marinus]TYA74442.1 hypothetical protein FUA24_14050 [Seonamhaeicola marinus]